MSAADRTLFSDERSATELFGKWLVYERVGAGYLDSDQFARLLGCKRTQLARAEAGSLFVANGSAAVEWPSDGFLKAYTVIRADLPDLLIKLRDNFVREPGGMVARTYRERLYRLSRQATEIESQLKLQPNVQDLVITRTDVQKNRYFWMRLIPLSVLSLLLSSLLATDLLRRRVGFNDFPPPKNRWAFYASWAELAAMILAIASDAILRKLAARVRKWTPLRKPAAELIRLAMPAGAGPAQGTYNYLGPLELARFNDQNAYIDAGVRIVGILFVAAVASTIAIAWRHSWSLWPFPAGVALFGLLSVVTLIFESQSLVRNVALNLRKRISEIKDL